MTAPTPELLRPRTWVLASEWASEHFTCDAHRPGGERCGRPVAWIIAHHDGTGPELGVCKRHALATRANYRSAP